jgi:hypothetical protein
MMKKYDRVVFALFIFVVTLGLLALAGCDRPRVGTPEYQNPASDTSPFQPAEEYSYLVDLDKAEQAMGESVQGIKDEMGQQSVVPGAEMPDFEAIMDEMGFTGLNKENVTAEANESMVHAHAEYSVEEPSELFTGLAQIGTAEVKLPTYFDQEVWMGHFFLANPGDLTELALNAMDASMQEMGAQMGGGQGMGMDMSLDSMLPMFGFQTREEIYDWMGNEFLVFSLLNKNFDPAGATTYENAPFYNLLAISATDNAKSLDAIERILGNPMMSMMGLQSERTEINGKDIVVLHPPSPEMFADYVDEAQLEQLASLPDTYAVAAGNYILIGDQYSVGAALAAMKETGTTTNRITSMELEFNIDGFLTQFDPSNAGPWVELIESEEFQDLMLRFYDATRELQELGTSRYSMLMQDGEHLELDVNTSKESLKFFEAIQGVINDTPSESWQKLGEMAGNILSEQSGMGSPGMPDTGMGEGSAPGDQGEGIGGDEGAGKPEPGSGSEDKPEGDEGSGGGGA